MFYCFKVIKFPNFINILYFIFRNYFFKRTFINFLSLLNNFIKINLLLFLIKLILFLFIIFNLIINLILIILDYL